MQMYKTNQWYYLQLHQIQISIVVIIVIVPKLQNMVVSYYIKTFLVSAPIQKVRMSELTLVY